MAVYARYVIRGMLGTLEVTVFLAILMASQASRRRGSSGGTFKHKNLGFIATRGNVLGARAMASLAALKLRAAPGV